MRVFGDRVIGAAGVLLGLAAAAEGWRLPAATETGEPGTRLFPIVLGGLIALLSALVVLRPAGPSESSAADRSGTSRLWTTVAVLAGYALAFERVGFPLATPLALGALLAGYGERRWTVLAGVSLGIAGATYLVFARWLGAPLPLGILGP